MEATKPTRQIKRLLMVMVEEGIVWDNPGKPRTILSSTTSTRIPANSLKRLGTKGWKLPDERVNSGSQSRLWTNSLLIPIGHRRGKRTVYFTCKAMEPIKENCRAEQKANRRENRTSSQRS